MHTSPIVAISMTSLAVAAVGASLGRSNRLGEAFVLVASAIALFVSLLLLADMLHLS